LDQKKKGKAQYRKNTHLTKRKKRNLHKNMSGSRSRQGSFGEGGRGGLTGKKKTLEFQKKKPTLKDQKKVLDAEKKTLARSFNGNHET